jgi:hypothetical protein
MKLNPKLRSTAMKFLSSKLVLNIVFAIAVVNVTSFLVVGRTRAVVYFVLIALLTAYFSKNMILILGVPLVLVNLLAMNTRLIEGNENMGADGADSKDGKDGKDGTDTKDEKEKKKSEPFEVGHRNKGKYDIDYASTVEDAYDDLNKLVGSDGIKRLTQDTQGLMKQQKQLTEAMEGMGDLMSKLGPMLDQVKGFGGGGKKTEPFGGGGKKSEPLKSNAGK